MIQYNVTEKTVTYKYYEIKQFFEVLNKFITTDGVGRDMSYAALKTINILEPVYKEIVEGIYKPENDPKVKEYQDGIKKLAFQYADRDEQGKTKVDPNGNPIVTEQIVEFQNAVQKYNEENKAVIDMANGANKFNQEYLSNSKEVKIFTLNSIEQCPDKLPPVLMYYFFKDSFN